MHELIENLAATKNVGKILCEWSLGSFAGSFIPLKKTCYVGCESVFFMISENIKPCEMPLEFGEVIHSGWASLKAETGKPGLFLTVDLSSQMQTLVYELNLSGLS